MSKTNTNNPGLYAVKMRASKGDVHLSGAERLAAEAEILPMAQALLRRAFEHANGAADAVHLKIEAIDTSAVLKVHSLPVAEAPAANVDEADGILFCTKQTVDSRSFFVCFFRKTPFSLINFKMFHS